VSALAPVQMTDSAHAMQAQEQVHTQTPNAPDRATIEHDPDTRGARSRWALPPGVPRSLPLRVLLLYGGLLLFAIGQVLALQCGLGANSWTVLHDGISQRTPLSIGMATQAMGIVMLVVALVSGVRPGLGTISNMLGVGFYIDALLWLDVIPEMEHWSGGLLMLLLAILVMGVGSALYIKAGFGAGPRDSFMLVIHRKTGLAIGRVRWLMEVSVVLIGIALGGAFGPGTIVFAMLVGPAVGYFFTRFRVATGETRRVRTITPTPAGAGAGSD
jgi:uncharacterized membrane protein YczE